MTQANVVAPLISNENALAKHAVNIHKFGGSSLATPECIVRVVDIIKTNCRINDIIVVSANGDTTDALFELLNLAETSDTSLLDKLNALLLAQTNIVESLLNASTASRLAKDLAIDFEQLSNWLNQTPISHHADILAFGELWSARVLAAVLSEQVCPSYAIDARDFLVINNENECLVEQDVSKAQLINCQRLSQLAVVTGYITKNVLGETCTLGRNGSDYSATIIGALLNAANVTLWTDVDGIYSADPRLVPLARKLHRLPNAVAKELGRLGNPVLHAKTLKPLVSRKIHLHVASSFDPKNSGTEIGKFGQIAKQELSVTHLNELLLVKFSQIDTNDFDTFCSAFNVLSKNSAEKFAVIHQSQHKSVEDFLASINAKVEYLPVALLAVVGHKVAEHGGVKARFKRCFNNLSVYSLTSSDNEHSLIAILSQPISPELLNNIHHDLTKDARHIGVVVAGLGNIGQRFLEMLPAQLNRVSALENVHLVGVISSSKALINNDGIEGSEAINRFNEQAQDYDNKLLLSWLKNHPYDELIVVDITPSESFSQLYLEFFKQGIHVIGANKWAASADQNIYSELVAQAHKNKSIWLGNTTVGAGLPINYAIEDLRNSGDNITEISGIFSGTLSWLFEKFDNSMPFSSLMLDALALGLTEPDPREDLSGRDVQRKLLILARAAGFTMSLDDINCQNLVPEMLRALPTQDFLLQANQLDHYFTREYSEAEASQLCIRYVATLKVKDDHMSANVGLISLDKTHPFAKLSPCDNVFQIKSQWYQDNPLIIRGPGAGRDVTAGGLHSDLVTLCQQLVDKKHQVKIKGLH